MQANKLNSKLKFFSLIWLAALLLLAGCTQPTPWRQESYVFGTRVDVTIVGASAEQASAAGNRVLREFDRLHRSYHAWQPSEVSTLNAAIAGGRTLTVSAELAALLGEAQAIAAVGEHLFDPGIGRLIGLWGFQSDEIQARLPDAAALAQLVTQRPGIAALKLNGQQVSSSNRAVALDFGGYLKGVALDRAAAALRADGIRHALINIGGNIMALGNREGRPGGAAWRVGIQHPRPHTVGGAPLATLELRDGEAIGTSGDYHRYFELDGRRYCHLLDPRTGQPAEGTQSVTILLPPGTAAGVRSDALSKPIFISAGDWQQMAKKLNVAAVLKVDAGGTVMATKAMMERLKFDIPNLNVALVE
jgi:thiamine biosynthesis lipoprotein